MITKKVFLKSFLVFFLMSIMAFSISALTEYTESGKGSSGLNSFERGTGIFDENVDYTTSAKTLGGGNRTILVADLDNDGQNEIIVSAGQEIKLYHGKSLLNANSYTISTTGSISNMEIFDVDNNGKKDIIFTTNKDASETIYFLEYNGTDLYANATISWSNASFSHSNGEAKVHCMQVQKCILVFSAQTDASTTGNRNLYSSGFNKTEIRPPATIASSSSIQNTGFDKYNWCNPQPSNVPFLTDLNVNSNSLYWFDLLLYNGAGAGGATNDEHLFMFGCYVTDTLTVSCPVSWHQDIGERLSDSSPSCADFDTGYSKYPFQVFSAPLVYDADENSGNGMEIIIAKDKGTSEFDISAYRTSGSVIESFPGGSNVDGQIISNPFRAYVFNQGSPSQKNELDSDFCVAGYSSTLQRIEFICGSLVVKPTGNLLLNNLEFSYSINGTFNITQVFGLYNTQAFGVQESGELLEANDYSEFLSPYGVFRTTRTSCSDSEANCGFSGICCDVVLGCSSAASFGFCSMNLIWDSPISSASYISANVENVDSGYEDLLALLPNNIYYFDDGYSNTPAYVVDVINDPCIPTSVALTNTTLTSYVKVHDVNSNDLVRAKVILYSGTPNEMDSGWSSNASLSNNEVTISISGILNKSITNGLAKVMASDLTNPTEIDVREFHYTVSDINGVSAGDCQATITYVAPTEEGEINITLDPDLLVTNQNDNAITNSLNAVDSGLNLNLGLSILWLIMMLVSAIFIIWALHSPKSAIGNKNIDTKTTLAIILVVEAILFAIGIALGYFNWTIIVTFVIISIVAFGFWIKNLVDKQGG